MKKLLVFITAFTVCNITASAQDQNFLDGLKAYDSKEYELSYKLMLPYAQKGNCMAQFIVGFVNQFGLAVPQNDSIARYWLLLSAEQKQPKAMGPLAANYFGSFTTRNRAVLITAYMWAMLALEYEPSQKYSATANVIRDKMKADEITEAEKRINTYTLKWKDQENCR